VNRQHLYQAIPVPGRVWEIERLRYQLLAIAKNPNLAVLRASNQVVGGSNPSGRTKIKDLDAVFLGAVLLTKLNSTNFAPLVRIAGLSTI
jgi:hypothetical protein